MTFKFKNRGDALQLKLTFYYYIITLLSHLMLITKSFFLHCWSYLVYLCMYNRPVFSVVSVYLRYWCSHSASPVKYTSHNHTVDQAPRLCVGRDILMLH